MLRENIFKLMYAFGVPSILRLGKSNQLTILSLHRISPERDFFFDPIDPIAFRKFLMYVQKHYQVISFQELEDLSKVKINKPLLMLSFDDGYFDFYEYALPILSEFKFSSNHNIVNDCASHNAIIWTQRLNYVFNHAKNNGINLTLEIEGIIHKLSDFNNNWHSFYLMVFHFLLTVKKEERIAFIEELENKYSAKAFYRMMNWKEIEDCSNNNVEIGSHTYYHDVISTIDDSELLIKEILISRSEIEVYINKPVNILALPNGKGSIEVESFVKDGGFKYLLYANDTTNSIHFNQKNNSFNTLNRINLLHENYPEMILRSELFHHKIRK
jgi:peptidoglycan/xylan/chitin deacetylase (PgdA/CDA1 family)